MVTLALPDAPPRAATRTVAEEISRTTRLIQSLRNSVAERASVGDRASHLLLLPLHKSGPLRVGELAAMVHVDASTVSRHVTELLRLGLVRREADPADGRASRLVITPAGERTSADINTRRVAFHAGLLAQWSDDHVDALATLLGRYNDDLAAEMDRLAVTSYAPAPAAPSREAVPA